MTKAERAYVSRLRELPCVICGAYGVEIHEPEQGFWFIALPLCPVCHRDPQRGWHGARMNWKAMKMDELKAINATVRMMTLTQGRG